MKKYAAIFFLGLLFSQTYLFAQSVEAKFNTFGGKKELKEIKKVYLADFAVKQIMQKKGTAKSGGGIGGNMAFAHMTVNFGGVDPAAYQQLVTELYDDAAKKLRDLGYEVITGEEAKSKLSKETSVINTVDEPSRDQYLGLITTIHPKDRILCFPKNIITAGMFNMRMAKDLDAIVIAFNYAVDYVAYGKSGGAFARKASIEAAPNLVVSGAMTASVTKGGGNATIEPIKAPDDWVGPEGIHQTSSGKMIPLFGMGASSSSSKWTMDINQETYLALLKSHLSAAVDASIRAWQEEIK